MSFQNRKQVILQLVETLGEIDVKELAKRLDTSEITIRRDLQQLTADGLVYRTHGGIMKNSLAQQTATFAQKAAVNAEAKDRICRRAAAEIQDGDVILMDCGSTVFRLCPFIRDKRIKVITNSLPVLYELVNSQVSMNLIGGEVDAELQAVHGSIAHEHVARYRATRAFVGVDGLSITNGLSAHSEQEANMTLAMAAQATTTYLLCDASKLGRESYLPFAPLSLANFLITNASAEQANAFEEAGLRVLAV